MHFSPMDQKILLKTQISYFWSRQISSLPLILSQHRNKLETMNVGSDIYVLISSDSYVIGM